MAAKDKKKVKKSKKTKCLDCGGRGYTDDGEVQCLTCKGTGKV